MHRQSWAKSRKSGRLNSINPSDYARIVFFTGAGMSAESGIPTYRGEGGIWEEYNWEEVACEEAFQNDPKKVLEFHEIRREKVFTSTPHAGHKMISNLQKKHNNVVIITQNIDGMHQLSGNTNVIELHGSIWRLRCLCDRVVINDRGRKYKCMKCDCGAWLRPDIVWFGDHLNSSIVQQAIETSGEGDLFISIGTSGGVWPAAGIPKFARENGAYMIEINLEDTVSTHLFDEKIYKPSSTALTELFSENY
jgi:NAD-dependent deacetylase